MEIAVTAKFPFDLNDEHALVSDGVDAGFRLG